MCKVLKIAKSSYYYKKKAKVYNSDLENGVIREFNLSHQIYGSRKLRKQMMSKQNGHAAYSIFRKRIMAIMVEHNLVSKYAQKRNSRGNKNKVNNDTIENKECRQFYNR